MITFRGEHVGSIMMFDDVAITLLRMMGMSGRRQGAILPEDIPEALERLQTALAEYRPPPSPRREEDEEDEAEPVISLNQRAYPLIVLLREALATRSYVTWGP
ncbi:MAG TPA: DUF1840 domain-containing protein [Candidatus Competibacteraceae bacterium]|nr:DUF1840 domain-containing protein [Candidatus Competibacteraceae bacterium]